MEEEIKNEETREATEESEEVHEEKQEVVAEEKPLDKMTVKELREVGKEIPDLSGVTAMKKDELVAAIKKAGITGKMTVSDGLPGGDGAVSERVIRILAEGALQPKLTPSYD